jgi:hypothetical protein
MAILVLDVLVITTFTVPCFQLPFAAVILTCHQQCPKLKHPSPISTLENPLLFKTVRAGTVSFQFQVHKIPLHKFGISGYFTFPAAVS